MYEEDDVISVPRKEMSEALKELKRGIDRVENRILGNDAVGHLVIMQDLRDAYYKIKFFVS
ncbi:MAG: hypothetical protein CR972_05085 [Candidatus Moraniibacteriota bacterium]|nr:MAG: hypothetical protein CR972_05085 [Candidatus Moranbacteria bacterium]